MIAFICYFFPAILSLCLFESLTKNSLSLKKCVYRFCFNTLSINFLCFAVKKFILQTAGMPMIFDGVDMVPSTAFNYIVMAVPIAIILVVLEVLISKKVEISVEDNNHEEET